MKIAYFTTAQDNNEFLKSQIESNPSNQVFHSNFIECLSLSNELNVFSCRSNAYGNKDSHSNTDGNTTWNYLKIKNNKLCNFYSQISESKKTNKEASIVFVDTMNTRCLLSARGYAKKHKIPLIGIVTDNPYNITGAKKFRCSLLIKTAKKCDGYICLTEDLNLLFNKFKKPNILIKGITKEIETEKSPLDYPYFFYAGTLLKKYGVIDLVDAFKSLSIDAKLVIAGHNNNDEFKTAIKDDSRIIYLGNIDNETVLKYENHSIANINPRPFMEEIDKYSVPSKVIEYSSKNSIIISGYSSKLKSSFQNNILWIDRENTLPKLLEEAYKLDSEAREEIINKTKSISRKEFSFNSVNKKLDEFISKLIK